MQKGSPLWCARLRPRLILIINSVGKLRCSPAWTWPCRRVIIAGILLALTAHAQARCTKTSVLATGDSYSALMPFGKINLYSPYLQPVGSLLASIVVPPTNYTTSSAVASSVLWECDLADLPNIYFLVATNGDDRVGGYYELGTVDGLSGVYATWFAYVGLRQTMSGVVLSRYWQKVPITSHYETASGKVQIRLQDIPNLYAELFRISSLPPTSGTGFSYYCGYNNTDNSGIGFANSTGRNYRCTQPNAYIQLAGETSVSFAFSHDDIGEDSANRFDFWGANNGFAYGMRASNTLFSVSSCVARSATPQVIFPPISVSTLLAGGQTSANFSVDIECDDNAVSGTESSQIAIGFQVSEGAYQNALQLGLVNSSGGVTTLVSDNYGDENIAQGVGIKLQNSLGSNLILVGQPGTVNLTTPGGNASGWYPGLTGASQVGTATSGYTQYRQNYTATLQQLPGVTPTAGRVKATTYVLVRMQ